jgi:hypothetical protein
MDEQPLSIRYELREEDLRQYYRYSIRCEPAARGMLWKLLLVIAALAVLLGLRAPLSPVTLLISLAIPAAALVLFLPLLVRWSAAQMARRSAQVAGVVGRQEVEASPRGVVRRTEAGETCVEWKAVSRLAAAPEQLLLYVGPEQPMLIPRRAFPSRPASDACFERLTAYHEAARSAGDARPPAEPAPLADHAEGPVVAYMLTLDDYAALQKHELGRLFREPRKAALMLLFLAVVPILYWTEGAWAAAGLLLFVAAMTFWIGPAADRCRVAQNPALLKPQTVSLSPDGLRWRQEAGEAGEAGEAVESRSDWSAVRRIVETDRHFFFFYAEGAALIVPRRAFPSPEAAARFIGAAREWKESAGGNSLTAERADRNPSTSGSARTP